MRQLLEDKLSKIYVNQMVSITTPSSSTFGKIERLAVESQKGYMEVILIIDGKRRTFEYDDFKDCVVKLN